jgi:hypothetical protein
VNSEPESPTCWGLSRRPPPQQVGDSDTVTLRNPKEPSLTLREILETTGGGMSGECLFQLTTLTLGQWNTNRLLKRSWIARARRNSAAT